MVLIGLIITELNSSRGSPRGSLGVSGNFHYSFSYDDTSVLYMAGAGYAIIVLDVILFCVWFVRRMAGKILCEPSTPLT